jgi:hypothetical protein
VKKIVSVSVGSSTRDHTTRVEFLGELCELTREGTDGDFDKAVELYKQYDGNIDAFGVGGAEFYLQVGDRKYYFQDIKRIREAIKISKVGDGNGIKSILAARAFVALEEYLNQTGETLVGMKALKTNAVDRYGMAEALVNAGAETVFGDFYFTMNLPILMKSLKSVRIVAGILLPVITHLPYMWFYPLGAAQEKEPENKYPHLYQDAQVIAGDFLQIRHYLPPDMTGKIIVTNTTTAANVELLRQRGVRLLVTTTPRLEGRSFGTNVMEATLRALIDKPDDQITRADFVDIIDRIPLKPNIEVLN